MNINRGLIVKKKWLDLILSGEKIWEIRGSNTKIRGKIGLIESGTGTIVGECEVVDSIKLDNKQYFSGENKHMITEHGLKPYLRPYFPNTHAWVIKNAKRYEHPISYTHPQGAVIWVKLK